MSRGFRLLLCWTAWVFLFSCRPTAEISREIGNLKKPEEVIATVEKTGTTFNTISLKAAVSLVGGKQKINFKAVIKMKRDSTIWIAATYLGIAGARVLITPDSLKTVNYRDKTYISEEYEKIQELFSTSLLSLRNLQSIFTGDLPELVDYQKLYMKTDSNTYIVTTLSDRKANKEWIEKKLQKLEKKIEKKEEKSSERGLERIERKVERRPDKFEGLDVEIQVSRQNNKIVKIEIKDYLLNGVIVTSYSDFRDTDAGKLPHHCHLTVKSEKEFEVDILYSKIEVDTEMNTYFSIPDEYERIRL